MKTCHIIILLGILQIPQLAMAIDFSKPSSEKVGAQSNEALQQTITKEKFFDMICEKAELIQNNSNQNDIADSSLKSPSPAGKTQNGSGYTYTPGVSVVAAAEEAIKAKYGFIGRNPALMKDTKPSSPVSSKESIAGKGAAESSKALKLLSQFFFITNGTLCVSGTPVDKLQGQACLNSTGPLIVGSSFLQTVFFNSYGKDLRKDKECQDAPYRVQDGYSAIVWYYAEKTPANENKAIQAMEEARKIPKKCSEKVVDFLTYADKRLGQCIK